MKWRDVADEYACRPELRKNDVQEILKWITTQPHLPTITEFEAILFLHSCYYDLEHAKRTIDIYYTTRTNCPEFFGNRDTSGKDVTDMMDVQIHTPLPGYTPEGYKMIFFSYLDLDPAKFDYTATTKLFSLVSDLQQWTEGTANGLIIILDTKGVTMGHLIRVKIMGFKRYISYLQDALPVRIKGLYFINSNSIVDKLLTMIKPFMNKHLMSMLKVFTNMEDVYKVIPKDMLPKELGGSTMTIEELHKEMRDKLAENRDFFLEFQHERLVDETKRPGKAKNGSDVIQSSFQQLEFD